MNLAMVCAKIGLDLSKLKKNTKNTPLFAQFQHFSIFFNFSKNRFNKEIRERIQLMSNHDANILSVLPKLIDPNASVTSNFSLGW